jgi:hypothetical protein
VTGIWPPETRSIPRSRRSNSPPTALADRRRGTASALASSAAEKELGFFLTTLDERWNARAFHSHALFRGARQAKNRAHGGARKFTSLTLAAGAVMLLPQSEHLSRSSSSGPSVNRRPNQRIS